ncbi:MAG: septum formation initiator family protein [Candidatus Sungbacteria bacterium]|uniref:Septum formation initiator family protein n=1 Tax=Candidatus Sungiibacteriota bacterium TaxID=2750080 RepID=A0A9D6QRX9_9BACT|nr:septum formation initiator family protein [Candidatus Sungbacteria bacterium]
MSKILKSPIVSIILISLIIWMSVKIFRVWRAYYSLSVSESKIEDKTSYYNAENKKLGEELRIANTPEAIERDAKARLNEKKPGEEVVVIIQSPTSSASTTSRGFFASIWQAFLSLFRR